MMRSKLVFLFSILAVTLFAQPGNDNCISAVNIPSVDNYCSTPMQFNNIGATADPATQQAVDDCVSINFNNGVWFSFRPSEPAILIEVGSGGQLGNIVGIRAVLYTGSCSTGLEYVDCSPGNTNVLEFQVADLTVGQRYYLFIESEIEGSFQLCLNDFIAPPSPESDCPEAVVLCDTSPFAVEGLSTAGNDDGELDQFVDACLNSEFQSAWYRWTCDDPGTLEFTLTPNDYIPGIESDDLDFAVFELPNGIDDCAGKTMLRCMASGQTGGCDFNTWMVCNGPTGMRAGESDCNLCNGGDDSNFISPIIMESGKSYALVVMNFNRSGQGFSIEWGGTGTFLGPEPLFSPEVVGNVLECDKIVEYTDLSDPRTDPIVAWSWNFGEGALPQRATGNELHSVVYESFGPKSVALTVESSRGCLVTEIIDIFVEPCCQDTTTLDLEVMAGEAICFGEETGSIQLIGLSGSPEYNYSVNGGESLPNNFYSNLGAGTYAVTVTDIKGCTDVAELELAELDEISIDAGFDLEVELGFQDTINTTVSPLSTDFTYMWSPEDGLDCENSDLIDCADPIVVSPGTTTYTVTITDENGCTATDQLEVRTNITRPFYAPTAITPNTQDIESTFILGFGRQASQVEELCIFDRWGNQVYLDRDIELDDNRETVRGWNGRFGAGVGRSSGASVNPGVYVWFARVRFIDDVVLSFAGDITVIK